LTESLQQEIGALRSLYWSERDPEGRAFAPLADAYRRAGDFRQAVELLREGLERHPDFVPGHVVAAQLFLEKGLLQESEIASRRAVELDEDNPVAWALLANALEARGAIAQARDARLRLAALETPPAPEPVPEPEAVDITELAPDEPIVDVAELAPDESAVDITDLAPDEPVFEMAALASDEAVVDVAELAPEDLPSDELPDAEPLVTRTMAELYARKGLTDRALGVFRQLLEVSPGDAELRRRVEELDQSFAPLAVAEPSTPAAEIEPEVADHQWASGALEAHHDVETPFAWTGAEEPEEAPAPERTLGAYFQRMLAWEPGGVRPGQHPSPSTDEA